MTKKSEQYSFSYNEFYKAYQDCIKNKRNTSNAIAFSTRYLERVAELCDEVNEGRYEIGKSIAFVVTKPVLREIFAADFRDRIVHHLVINELMPYFEKEFITESFSYREGKGTLYGVNTMYEYIRECSESYTKDAWILKMDIKSFFMSIDKRLLADMLLEFIEEKYPQNRKKEKLKELCEMIVMHHPEHNCELRGNIKLWDKLEPSKSLFKTVDERGLAIGNLTSQIFANFYLSKLDYFIKYELSFKYYGRYVDDFIIVCENKERLLMAVPLITDFAKKELRIMIHPKKRYIQHYTKGVKFIGGVLKKGRKYISNRTKGNLYHKLKYEFAKPVKERLEKMISSVNSYLGFMSQYSSYRIRKQMLMKEGLLDKWMEYIIIDPRYRKINLKK